MPSPVTGVVATTWNAGIRGAGAGVDGREGAGAETRREGAGASDREGGARRGAGSARRGGRGAGRGAVTVTSGSVSDTWPQADSDEKAPNATAAKSSRFQTGRRDELRLITPHAANTNAPKASPRGILSHFSAYGLVMFWQIEWEHLAMCPLGHTCEG